MTAAARVAVAVERALAKAGVAEALVVLVGWEAVVVGAVKWVAGVWVEAGRASQRVEVVRAVEVRVVERAVVRAEAVAVGVVKVGVARVGVARVAEMAARWVVELMAAGRA